MSDTLTQPSPLPNPADLRLETRPSRRRWPRILILLLVLLWILNESISFAIQHSALNRKITARLETAFGRSVEVEGYSFSLWGRPTIEARSVTVGEDPRFGHEYFLRAESLTMSVRWQSLLRGRLEFGAISLSRPSLNLVRNPDGDWNVAEWLPQFSGTSGSAAVPAPASPNPSGASSPLRFSRIDVDSGRINFKRAEEKLPFALIGVTGFVEPEGSGRWRLDLEAVPYRAAVILQQAGTLHLSGHIGGTSSRLRPADLALSWTDASISDVLRLVRATDYGIRGNLAIALNARTEAQDWMLEGRAEIRQVHRWDLPLRADNPSLNLIASGTLHPEDARFDFSGATIESPRSNATATGAISWNEPAAILPPGAPREPRLQIASSGIDMADVLAWAHAFRPAISDDLAVRGLATLDLAVAGWPPRLDGGTLAIQSAAMSGRTLPVPILLGASAIHYDARGLSVPPSTLSFGAAGGALHFETIGSLIPFPSAGMLPNRSQAADARSSPRSLAAARASSSSKIAPGFRVAGTLADAGDLISAARLLGWDISRGWDLTGPVRCDVKWLGAHAPWRNPAVGTLDLGVSSAANVGPESAAKSPGDSLRAPFLNLPIEQIRAHVDLKPGARHVTLSSAEAFGAHWTGSFDRRVPEPPTFPSAPSPTSALATDRLPNSAASRAANSPHRTATYFAEVRRPAAPKNNSLDADAASDPAPTAKPWQFSLSADHLSSAELDRWLNPRWRESFLDRVLPFLNSRPLAAARPELLAAAGTLSIDQFELAPFVVRRIQAEASLDGRRVTLSAARAQFYKGDLAGSLRADLDPTPVYRLNLDFSNIDLASLSASAPSLADRFSGAASGKISIAARGASRAGLLSSLQCHGTARIAAPELKTINLVESFATVKFQPGASQFRDASASFSCADSKLAFQHLRLSTAALDLSADGTIDFNRSLDLKFAGLSPASELASPISAPNPTPTSAPNPPRTLASAQNSYRLSGTLDAPEITRLKSSPPLP